MNIELTEKERKFLAEFAAKQYEGADANLGTATPIHVVERIEKEFVQDGSEAVWVDADSDEYYQYKSLDDLIKARQKLGEGLSNYEDVKYKANIGDVFVGSPSAYCQAYNVNVYSGRYIR